MENKNKLVNNYNVLVINKMYHIFQFVSILHFSSYICRMKTFTPKELLDILVSWERTLNPGEFPLPFSKSSPREYAERLGLKDEFIKLAIAQPRSNRPSYDSYHPRVLDTSSMREAESMMDDNRSRFKDSMQRWWKSLSHDEKVEEARKDESNQLQFYISDFIPKVKKYSYTRTNPNKPDQYPEKSFPDGFMPRFIISFDVKSKNKSKIVESIIKKCNFVKPVWRLAGDEEYFYRLTSGASASDAGISAYLKSKDVEECYPVSTQMRVALDSTIKKFKLNVTRI